MGEPQTFLIVGGSLAGAKAAETLRSEGFDGRVLLLGSEAERPYERPPLSKDYLRGETPRDRVYVHPQSFYEENAIELRTASEVTALDPSASEVVIGGSERLRFGRLLLATGARPRRLALPGSDLDRIYYLRDLRDSDAIRDRIEQGGRLVVIGAGWIGAEVAASARERGVEVTVIHQGALPLQRVLGEEVGGIYREIHGDHGVALLAETGVEAFEGQGAVESVRTEDGRRLDCDFVGVGVGVLPRAELAERAGLPIDNGLVVDERLQAAPGIFAAGDVANARHPLFGGHLRVEHWDNARRQGAAAARSMLGRTERYDRIPYFFSDQYETAMEYWGHGASWDEVVFRGDVEDREFLAFWLAGRRVAAGMSMNVSEAGESIQELIREGKEVNARRLRDPDVPLEDVVTEPVGRRPKPPAKPLLRARNVMAEGVNYARRFVGDRLVRPEPTAVADLALGEGRVVEADGERVAVYKDEQGRVRAVSPVCTHLRCIVDWNATEKTWDCPCHGSRFDYEGRVLKGPAKRELEKKAVPGSQG